jgi:hypothetical protein
MASIKQLRKEQNEKHELNIIDEFLKKNYHNI